MIRVGDKVMVRDPYIKLEWMIPQAEVVDEVDNGIAFTKCFKLRWSNGKTSWFAQWELKVE